MNLDERRHNTRTKLQHIAYISFNSGNGAIVLDVSQGGLAFRAVAPVESNETIRFHLPGKSMSRLEITAELAWNDKTKKSGGLRFIALPEEFRQQVLVSLGHPPWAQATVLPTTPSVGNFSLNAASSHPKILPKASTPANGPREWIPIRTAAATKAVMRSYTGVGVKLWAAMVLGVFVFNCVAMFAVRHAIQARLRWEIVIDSHNALSASQAQFHEMEELLKHKADLLSALVAMTPSGDATLQNAIDDSLISDGTDLLVVMDGANQITAFHNPDQSMTIATAQGMVLRALSGRDIPQWWFANGRLYRAVLQAQNNRALANNNSGTIVVGLQIDDKLMEFLKAILGGDAAFSYGGGIVESTLNSSNQMELSQTLLSRSGSQKIQIGNQTFNASSMNLENGAGPTVLYTFLKPDEQNSAFSARLDRRLIQLGGIELLLMLAFVVFSFVKTPGTQSAETR